MQKTQIYKTQIDKTETQKNNALKKLRYNSFILINAYILYTIMLPKLQSININQFDHMYCKY